MKKILTYIILILNSFILNAQVSVQGVVVDKDTQTPVTDVIVQYGTSSKDYIYTNSNGKFSLPENTEDVIHFQCFGYKPKSVLKSTLIRNRVVELELNPVSLNPVIISPGDVDALLDEVMINTKKKLLTDVPVAYLLHFLQTKTTDTLQNEIYMKYATTVREKDLKKTMKVERVPYIYNIIDIGRVQEAVTPTSELYGAEYHASHLFTFGKSANNETTRSYTSDSSLIILQIEPLKGKEGWANGEIRIRSDDMTIYSMEIESVDSIMEAQPYKRYMGKMIKILKKAGRFEFRKAGDKYFLKNCYTYYKFKAVSECGLEEEIAYYCDVKSLGYIEKINLRKRQLSGYCQELFYFPTSTQREFWAEDGFVELGVFKDNTSELSGGIAPSTETKNQKTNWANALFAIPLFGLLFLL